MCSGGSEFRRRVSHREEKKSLRKTNFTPTQTNRCDHQHLEYFKNFYYYLQKKKRSSSAHSVQLAIEAFSPLLSLKIHSVGLRPLIPPLSYPSPFRACIRLCACFSALMNIDSSSFFSFFVLLELPFRFTLPHKILFPFWARRIMAAL